MRDSPAGTATKFLLATLLRQADYLEVLCNPDCFTVEQSITLVEEAKTLDPQVEMNLAKMLCPVRFVTERQSRIATRVLEVFDRTADPATAMPTLRQLMQSSNERVRSKAALLIERIGRNPQWAKRGAIEQDPRVFANAVESLWGLDTPAAKAAFWEATHDVHHRVAANAAVGLYLAGDPEAAAVLFQLGRHARADFRSAAAWAMGRTGDARFLAVLDALAADPASPVVSSARTGASAIRQRVTGLQSMGTIDVHIRFAVWQENEHKVEVKVEVKVEGVRNGGQGTDWRKFVIWNGQEVVEDFLVDEIAQSTPRDYRLDFSAPHSASRLVRVQLFSDQGTGEDTALDLTF